MENLQDTNKPVAWMSKEDDCIFLDKDKPNPMDYDFWTPLYTTSPQRKPLTDKEIVLIVAECAASHQHTDIHFARAIEAKLKEKNT